MSAVEPSIFPFGATCLLGARVFFQNILVPFKFSSHGWLLDPDGVTFTFTVLHIGGGRLHNYVVVSVDSLDAQYKRMCTA